MSAESSVETVFAAVMLGCVLLLIVVNVLVKIYDWAKLGLLNPIEAWEYGLYRMGLWNQWSAVRRAVRRRIFLWKQRASRARYISDDDDDDDRLRMPAVPSPAVDRAADRGDSAATVRLSRDHWQRTQDQAERAGDLVQDMLFLREWLDRANHQPDIAPHLIVAGPTGSGKTLLTLALLNDRPGRLVITTPKPPHTDPWGGLPAVRLDDDLSMTSIGAAIEQVYTEMLRRNAQHAEPNPEPLTLVIDEYPLTCEEVRGIQATILRMLRFGRSAGIRVILLAQETSVKALGLEGNGGARSNCLFIECKPEYRAEMYRWAATPVPIDTRRVPDLAAQRIHPVRWWQPAPERAAAPAREARAEPAAPAPTSRHSTGRPGPRRPRRRAARPDIEPETEISNADDLLASLMETHGPVRDGAVPAWLTPEVIAILYRELGSKNKVAQLLVGTKIRRIEQIDAALEDVDEHSPSR